MTKKRPVQYTSIVWPESITEYRWGWHEVCARPERTRPKVEMNFVGWMFYTDDPLLLDTIREAITKKTALLVDWYDDGIGQRMVGCELMEQRRTA